MKKIDTSAISTTTGMPIKSGTIDHLQNAYIEAMSSIVTSTIVPAYQYSTNVGYKLWGCENTGSGSNYIIGQGAVFFNGEVFQVPAATFTISGTNVAVGSIQTTYFSATNADPVTFTDSVNRNVHQIRQIVFAPGLSGSGAFDYNNAFDIRSKPQGCIGQIINIALDTSQISSNFDSSGRGTSERLKGWAICNGNNGTYNLKGRVLVAYNPSDGDFNTLGATGGEKTHQLTKAELPLYNLTRGTNSESVQGGSNVIQGNSTGTAGTEIISSGGGDQPHNNLQPYAVVLMIERIY